MSSSLVKLIAVAFVLVIIGAMAIVAFRAYVYDEVHWALFLAALAIGAGLGMVAKHSARRWPNVVIAAAAAWMCGLASLATIELLERNAVAAEFDRRGLSEPDFYIALEAYKISESARPTGRIFTNATGRTSYNEATWRAASDSWNAKPEAEKQAIKREWESDYERLNRNICSKLAEVFFAPHYLLVYAICSIIAAAIMLVSAQEGTS
jgi:hypothetical protein